jgi:hypothetical protein
MSDEDYKPGFFPRDKTHLGVRDKINALVKECRTYEISDETSKLVKAIVDACRYAPAISVLRVLAENTVYDTRSHNYGWVVKEIGTVEELAALTGFGRTAVKTALGKLEAAEMATRVPQPNIQGRPNRIRFDLVLIDAETSFAKDGDEDAAE